jgi:hypothetical protein
VEINGWCNTQPFISIIIQDIDGVINTWALIVL